MSRRIPAQGRPPQKVSEQRPAMDLPVKSQVVFRTKRVREARVDGGAMSRPKPRRRLGPTWLGHHAQEVRAWSTV